MNVFTEHDTRGQPCLLAVPAQGTSSLSRGWLPWPSGRALGGGRGGRVILPPRCQCRNLRLPAPGSPQISEPLVFWPSKLAKIPYLAHTQPYAHSRTCTLLYTHMHTLKQAYKQKQTQTNTWCIESFQQLVLNEKLHSIFVLLISQSLPCLVLGFFIIAIN